MKTIKLILIYLSTFVMFFLLLSAIGMLWDSYYNITSDITWFIVYTMFFGWWLALLPTREYYMRNYHYFDKIF